MSSVLVFRPGIAEPDDDPSRIHGVRETKELLSCRLLPLFRLLGVGLSELTPADGADLSGDLLDPDAPRRAAAERATDAIRARFGEDAIVKGRALR